jgi:hypothetical protein
MKERLEREHDLWRSLVGKTITSVEGFEDGFPTLRLSNGQAVELSGSSENYGVIIAAVEGPLRQEWSSAPWRTGKAEVSDPERGSTEEEVWTAVKALGRLNNPLNVMSAMLLYFESKGIPVQRGIAPDKSSTDWHIDTRRLIRPPVSNDC